MAKPEVVLPPVVREKAAQLGDAGAAWLSGLPALIDDLERRWSVTIGEPLNGGTASYVARARTADGRDAVVKLSVPDPAFTRQIRTLAAARGRGYVRLLAHDEENYAVLLEALGPPLNHLGLSPEVQIDTLCDMLPAAWQVPPPTSPNAEPALDKARSLAELVARLWEDLGHPCSERIAEYAIQCAERRAAAFDPDRCVIVHGDAASPNAVQVLAPRAGAESGFVFVDPDGFLGDPTYDLGVVLRDWCPELLAGDVPSVAHRYCRQIAARTGMEEAAIWEWGFLERVSTGLYSLSLTTEDLTPPHLTTAETLL
jgi:streptomycin 6-kinase